MLTELLKTSCFVYPLQNQMVMYDESARIANGAVEASVCITLSDDLGGASLRTIAFLSALWKAEWMCSGWGCGLVARALL